ncbi:MAG: hypothetical protein M5R36_25780 [Deltaproteobacteria bacterium]|nr:hypothetical protein [Deltaproteobacteria bacterium]
MLAVEAVEGEAFLNLPATRPREPQQVEGDEHDVRFVRGEDENGRGEIVVHARGGARRNHAAEADRLRMIVFVRRDDGASRRGVEPAILRRPIEIVVARIVVILGCRGGVVRIVVARRTATARRREQQHGQAGGEPPAIFT